MNTAYQQLKGFVMQTSSVTEDQLLQTLFSLRAHYSLAGLIVICQRIIELVDKENSDKANYIDFTEFSDELNTIRLISTLKHDQSLKDCEKLSHFKSETINKNKHKPTPLRPFTGDSGICDLLLIQSELKEANTAFDKVLVWFLRQIFYFQRHVHTLEKYKIYLFGSGTSKLKDQKGSRIYNAFLAIRQLGDPTYEYPLKEVQKLIKKYPEVELIKKMREGHTDARLNLIFYSLQLFLSQIWESTTLDDKKKRQAFLHRIGHKHQQLALQRYGSLSIAMQSLDEADEIHRGLLSEVYATSLIEEDDPPLEPLFIFFLAEQRDLIRGLYAAKSASQHIEAANVGLPWVKWRLSSTAIQAVLQVCQPCNTDTSLVSRAKLALVLSLITGRPVLELSAPHFDFSTDNISVCLTSNILSVPAGKPVLKKEPEASPFHLPQAFHLRLVLPDDLKALIHQVAKLGIKKQQPAVEREAKALLQQLPAHLEVSLKSIKETLPRLLYEYSRGDLAVVKAITNASGRNYESLIHYASFNQDQLENLWRDCVLKLGVNVPLSYFATMGRVGSPIAIDVVPVHQLISSLKSKMQQAVDEQDWQALLEAMTLYTVLWINLATAGRGIQQPFPKFVSENGWALIQDKHHQDESTDRYVPLNMALVNQIQALHGLMQMLGFKVAQHIDLTSYALQVIGSNQVTGLVRNWARKLVRSEQNSLLGRFKDAGLGHWVRGRHPWEMLSVFPAMAFKTQWLEMQEGLQAKLGFEYFNFEDIQYCPQFDLPLITSNVKSLNPAVEYSMQDVQGWLEKSEFEPYRALVFNSDPGPSIALELGHKLVAELAKDPQIDLPQAARQFCAYVREQTQVPLFVQLPNHCSRSWLTSEDSFASWCYVEQNLLGSIQQDLKHLPAREANIDIVIGRLLVVLSWKSQLCRASHLQAMLQFVASNEPLVAMGDSRLVELSVNNDRSISKVRRTVLLSSYVSTLILVDRAYVQTRLQEILGKSISQQRHAWKKCFHAYLKSLGIASQISLSQWLKALQQNIMLSSCALLAGYATGQVATSDLSINELLRVSGYELLSHSKDTPMTESDILVSDEQLSTSDLLQKINQLKGQSAASSWLEQCAEQDEDHQTVTLLKGFLRWQVLRCSESLSIQNQNLIQLRIAIVSAGILGFSTDLTADSYIDEDIFSQWVELTQVHFPHRQHVAAWNKFREFLLQLNNPCIKLNKQLSHQVSAKVFARHEVQQVVQCLQSIESGVGDIRLRQVIQRHFRLASAMGVRRSEALHLRHIDVDQDMLRIRPYGKHKLKTLGSERVVPFGLLSEAVQQGLQHSSVQENGSVLTLHHQIERPQFFSQIAQLLKQVTADPDLGLHHLRHTFASSYALKCFQNVVNLDGIQQEFSWLGSWMPTDQQFDILLGQEGQVGQGLKAVSRVLGHLHESTTLKHYVHVLFLVSYAYSLQQTQYPLHTAFFRRVMSRSTLFRHYQDIVQTGSDVQYRLRDVIEQHVLKKNKASWMVYTQKRTMNNTYPSQHSLFQQFEMIERYLMLGQGHPPHNIEAWQIALQKLAQIPSGKRGSKISRHFLPTQGKLTLLPQALKSADEAIQAQMLLERLERLKQNKPQTYDRLVEKWLYHSDTTKVLMRRTKQDEFMIQALEKYHLYPTLVKNGKNEYFRIMHQHASLNAMRWVLTWLSIEGLKSHSFLLK